MRRVLCLLFLSACGTAAEPEAEDCLAGAKRGELGDFPVATYEEQCLEQRVGDDATVCDSEQWLDEETVLCLASIEGLTRDEIDEAWPFLSDEPVWQVIDEFRAADGSERVEVVVFHAVSGEVISHEVEEVEDVEEGCKSTPEADCGEDTGF